MNARAHRQAGQREPSSECNVLSGDVTRLRVSAPVVHDNRAVAERLRRDKFEPSRAGQPAVVQGRAVTSDPWMDEEPVLVDQIQPIQFGRERAATEEYSVRGRVLQLLYSRAQ